jgi:hypothetical protein
MPNHFYQQSPFHGGLFYMGRRQTVDGSFTSFHGIEMPIGCESPWLTDPGFFIFVTGIYLNDGHQVRKSGCACDESERAEPRDLELMRDAFSTQDYEGVSKPLSSRNICHTKCREWRCIRTPEDPRHQTTKGWCAIPSYQIQTVTGYQKDRL